MCGDRGQMREHGGKMRLAGSQMRDQREVRTGCEMRDEREVRAGCEVRHQREVRAECEVRDQHEVTLRREVFVEAQAETGIIEPPR